MLRPIACVVVAVLAALSGLSAGAQTTWVLQGQWPVQAGAEDLEVDAEGNFWLLYRAGHQVRKYFASQGYDSLQVIGGRGVGGEAFAEPTQLAAAGRSEVYVLDYGNQRLVLLSTNLRVSRILDFAAPLRTSMDSERDLFLFPKSVACAFSGELFLLNQDDNRIFKFDALGRYELSFGGTGYGEGSLSEPAGDVKASADGRVFVGLPVSQELVVFSLFGMYQARVRPPVAWQDFLPWDRALLVWNNAHLTVWVPGAQSPAAELLLDAPVQDVAVVGRRLYVLAGDVVRLYSIQE